MPESLSNMLNSAIDACSPVESRLVHFRQIGFRGPAGRQFQQFVGLPGLGGKHHDYLVSLIQSGFHLPAHHFQAVDVGDGRPSEFLYQNTHS